MAHVPETRTTFDNALKYRYEGPLRNITPERSITMTLLQNRAGKVGWSGKSVTDALQLNYLGSTDAVAEGGTLPDSLPVNIVNCTIPMKYNYFSVDATGPAMATSHDTEGAFGEAWATQVFNKHKAYRQQLNRQCLGDGLAILAQVDGTPSLSGSDYTITLDNAFGISGMNNSAVNGHIFTSTNQKVTFYSGSSKRDDGGVKITSWTKGVFPSTSSTIVCDDGDCDEVADGDYMYTHYGYGNEMAGLRLLIDDNTIASTVQSLSADTYAEWRSEIGYGSTPGTAEALTRLRMGTLQSQIEANDGKTDFILTSPAVWLTYGDTCAAENINLNAKVLDNGFTTVEFNGVPMYKDTTMWDEMFWVDTSTLFKYEAKPEGWLNEDGDVIKQARQKDVWEAYWGWYANLGTIDRSKNGKMVDISVRANRVA